MLSIVKKEITAKKPREAIKMTVPPPSRTIKKKSTENLQKGSEQQENNKKHQKSNGSSSDNTEKSTTKSTAATSKKDISSTAKISKKGKTKSYKPKSAKKSSPLSMSSLKKDSDTDSSTSTPAAQKGKAKTKSNKETRNSDKPNVLNTRPRQEQNKNTAATELSAFTKINTTSKPNNNTDTAVNNFNDTDNKNNFLRDSSKIEIIKMSTNAKSKKKKDNDTEGTTETNIENISETGDKVTRKPPLLGKKKIHKIASRFDDKSIVPVEKQLGIFEEIKEGQGGHNVGGRSVFKHRSSICLYKEGFEPGHALDEPSIVTKNGRPIFHLALNESTTSFLDNSRNNSSGGGFLEMSSGLLPHHPKSKYNFKISLDDTNEISQTAAMLKDYIFDENNEWNTERTESNRHNNKKGVNSNSSLPSYICETDESIGQEVSFIIPSTQTTDRSYMISNRSNTTRLSFLYNKKTGFLCKNCFSATCSHMQKFSSLADDNVKKNVKSPGGIFEANSSDITRQTYPSEASLPSYDQKEFQSPNKNVQDLKQLLQPLNLNNTNESLRLVDIQECYYPDQSGTAVSFQELQMELEMSFQPETSTPNEEESPVNIINNLDQSANTGIYTPAPMKQDSNTAGNSRPTTNDTLQYDSDYDDASYLNACKGQTNSTFEQLDLCTGVFFSNSENNSNEDVYQIDGEQYEMINAYLDNSFDRSFKNGSGNNQIQRLQKRKMSLGISNLDTVFEGEESSARSATSAAHSNRTENMGSLTELIAIVDDTIRTQSRDSSRPVNNNSTSITTNSNDKESSDSNYDDKYSDKIDKEEKTGVYENGNIEEGIHNPKKKPSMRKEREELETETPEVPTKFYNKVETEEGEEEEESNQCEKESNTVEKNEVQKTQDGDVKLMEETTEERKIDENMHPDLNQNLIHSNTETITDEENADKQTPDTNSQNYTSEENQSSFRRIQDKDEEMLQYLSEDELQLWLQANRKYCFEKDFHGTQHDVDENNNTDLLPEDREVLEINTPEWKRDRKIASNNEKEVKEGNNDESNNYKNNTNNHHEITKNSIIPTSIETQQLQDDNRSNHPGTGNSTLGSYRHIDLLVISRSDEEDSEHNQIDYNDLESNYSDGIDSGVHSTTNTIQSTVILPEEPETRGSHREIETLIIRNRQSIQNEDTAIMSPLSRTDHTGNHVSFPLIDSIDVTRKKQSMKSSQSRTTVSEDFSYFDYPREITSPMLEHHKRMAQFHRDRIELLTPLVHGSDSRYPKPPGTPCYTKRRYSSKHRYISDSSSDTSSHSYVDNLNSISPRTKPYVPHPPSYDSTRIKIKTSASHDYHYPRNGFPTQLSNGNPYYDRPIYIENMQKDPTWQRINQQRQLLRRQHIQKTYARTKDPKYDTTLFLTVPFRSLNIK